MKRRHEQRKAEPEDEEGKQEPPTTQTGVTTKTNDGGTFQNLFGFRLSDLSSWGNFVRLVSRPTDPATLASFRVLYGSIMLIDTFFERGLTHVPLSYAYEDTCHFPLFPFLKPFPAQWLVMLYVSMIIGICGITLGAFFRLSCVLFTVPYWYLWLLDKIHWNNHSYLFGLFAFFFVISDAHHCFSVDGLRNRNIRNSDVPLWNYGVLRAQIILVYFVAGLKKIDWDWVSGHSMGHHFALPHYVFYPFKYLLGEALVSHLVHHCGLAIDLSVGFLLFFDQTRSVGVFVCYTFHLLNAQLFNIGMFPLMMEASIFLFFCPDWPRIVWHEAFSNEPYVAPDTQPSTHCLYTKPQAKPEDASETKHDDKAEKQTTPPTTPSRRHHAAAVFTILFITTQMFLPFSHPITKGYNTWTQGLYGYSWDMMVHSFQSGHLTISYVDKDTGHRGYLNPQVSGVGTHWRPFMKGDHVKDIARCVATRLHRQNITNVEIYIDAWVAMNERVPQRVVDPRVDVLAAEWGVFQDTPWMLPLLEDLTGWQGKLQAIAHSNINQHGPLLQVAFFGDFAGLYLETYLPADIGIANISVLQGMVEVEVIPEEGSDLLPHNTTVQQDQEMQLPSGQFHRVYTVSEGGAVYMYKTINTTTLAFLEGFKAYQLAVNASTDNKTAELFASDPRVEQYTKMLKLKNETSNQTATFVEDFQIRMSQHIAQLIQGVRIIQAALVTIFTGEPFLIVYQNLTVKE